MRAFIAIELPQPIKNTLNNLAKRLEQTGADVKWVEPKNIHLTLKFLGETSEEKLSEIKTIINSIAKNNTCFKASISSIGAFPKIDYPRVIWVGLSGGDKELRKIASELEIKIEETGIPREEREFSSHITLGRVRSAKNRLELIQELKKLETEAADLLKNVEFDVKFITLFKSTLSPKGAIYETLIEANLKAS